MSPFYACLTACLLVVVSSYKAGPPVGDVGICSGMNPAEGHGVQAQTRTSPYKITVDNVNGCYKAGAKLSVTVKGADEIEGIFFQARKVVAPDVQLNPSIGKMDTAGNSKLQKLDCFDGTDNAIGHNDELETESVTFHWTAPDSGTDKIYFIGTVVHEKDTFWVGLASSELSYNADCVVSAVTDSQGRPVMSVLLLVSAILLALGLYV